MSDAMIAYANVEELESLEAIVRRGQQTFIEVGLAMGQIADKGLFTLKGFDTFAAYLAAEWPEITPRRAYFMIQEATQADEVNRGSQGAVTIESGRAARAIAVAGLPTAEARVELAQAAAERHPDGKVTGPGVEAVLAERAATQPDDLTSEEEDEAARVASVLTPFRKKTATPVAAQTSKGSNEWFTPDKYTDSVHVVLGSIDLDPFSCELANWGDGTRKGVRAASFFDKKTNGLLQEWRARALFMNPHYTETAACIEKLLHHYREGHVAEAIALVNSKTSARWFRSLWNFPICFTDHRIPFDPGEGQSDESPSHGNAFIYLGDRHEAFAREFAKHGNTVVRFQEAF